MRRLAICTAHGNRAGRLDDAHGGTRVEPVRVLDAQFHGGGFRVGGVRRRRGGRCVAGHRAAKLLLLLTKRALGLGAHVGERCADADLRGGGNRPFDQRSRAQRHPGAHRFAQQIERQFGAQERAAQVQQHQHTLGGIKLLHGGHDRRGVGAEFPALVRTGSRGHGHLAAVQAVHHVLERQRERLAVRNENEADHDEGYRRCGQDANEPTNQAAAASASAASSSELETAPGSRWPALRSPR